MLHEFHLIIADDDIIQEPQNFLQLTGSATVVLGPAGHTAVLVVVGGRGPQVIVATITDDVTLDNYQYYIDEVEILTQYKPGDTAAVSSAS